jgi:hypothetical protein
MYPVLDIIQNHVNVEWCQFIAGVISQECLWLTVEPSLLQPPPVSPATANALGAGDGDLLEYRQHTTHTLRASMK